jgi:hypothetical protein
MAQQFLREKGGPSTSYSALKAEIGAREPYNLKRSAAIEAINQGLKDLKRPKSLNFLNKRLRISLPSHAVRKSSGAITEPDDADVECSR